MTSLLRLDLRTQRLTADAAGRTVWEVIERPVAWAADETALLLCDVWDSHWSRGAAERLAALVPRMNAVVAAARAAGCLIIHAPSDTMPYYAEHPARQRALATPRVAPPAEVPHDDPPLPIDDSDGGSDTGEPAPTAPGPASTPASRSTQPATPSPTTAPRSTPCCAPPGGATSCSWACIPTCASCAAPLPSSRWCAGGGGGPPARPDRRHVLPSAGPLRLSRGGHPPGGGLY